MTTPLTLPTGNAICCSGDRDGQNPGEKTYPSLDEIRDDLAILRRRWPLLRLDDCSPHADRVLQVIAEDKLPFEVMLGAYLGAEMNNFGCPWGVTYTEEQLEASCAEHVAEVDRLIALANRYPGNENWKGPPDPLEPEKHWGLFTADRRPRLVMQALYPDLTPQAADA